MRVSETAIITPDQQQPMPTLLAQLDASRGVYWPSYEDTGIDPSERIRLSGLARLLGRVALPHTLAEQNDRLQITEIDRLHATDRTWTEASLYIWPDDPRYNDGVGEQIVKVQSTAGVNHAVQQKLVLPFTLHYNQRYRKFDQPGVVFPEDEYGLIARNPGAVVANIRARTRKSIGKHNKDLSPDDKAYVRRGEANRRVDSSGAKGARHYIESLKSLDERYVAENALTRSLRRQTYVFIPGAKQPVGPYKVKNLDKRRKQVEELFAQRTEVVALNAGLADNEVAAMHRARTRELFGTHGSTADTDRAWRRQLVVQELYTNARRFKLLQSVFACEAYHAIYRPAMREVFFANQPLPEQRVA